jgi:hypothetical protein
MIIRMNKIGREVRGRPVGTRENPGGASRNQYHFSTKKWDASGRRKIAFAFDNVKQVNEELE